jgi:starch-binding outer membrane protein, SusD/RagB family
MNSRNLKISKYVAALFFVVLLSSCADYFELTRPPQAPWLTLESFERAPIGAYASLFSGDQWNMPWVNDRFVKSDMGDDVSFADEPDKGFFRDTKQANTWTENTFVSCYRAIATVNDALGFANSNNGNPFPASTPAEITNNLNRIVGELHFVRAYAYYLLQTTFGHTIGTGNIPDIPMPVSYAKSAEEARNPRIGTAQEVFTLIVNDLKIAKSLLPEKFDASLHPASYSVRANKFAASGMLVRAYLQKGVYDSALLEADYIIGSGQYNLTEDPIEAFNKSTLESGKEVIFYAPFYDSDNRLPVPNHLSVINDTWNGSLCPWVQAFMAFSVVQRINWMPNPKTDTTLSPVAKRDKRFSQLMSVRYPVDKHTASQESDYPRMRKTMVPYTTIICNKYYRGVKKMNTNVPLIRLAEIYLTRSILRFKSGDLAGAANDLNVVRARAWNQSVAGSSYSPVTAGSISENMIHDERIIELFNEGDRINYLRALKMPIPKGEDRQVNSPGPTDPYDSESFVWVIPSVELNFNDKL